MPKTVDLKPEIETLDFARLFNSLPQSYIVFKANDPIFTVAAENLTHEAVGMLRHHSTTGRPALEIWPDTTKKFRKTGVSDLIESFRKVIRTGLPDDMGTVRYDLHAANGKLTQQYWRLSHHPLFDRHGKLTHIYQATVNVTEEVIADRKRDQVQRQLDEALSIGLIGTWLWELKEGYVFADKNLLRLYGINAEMAVDGLPAAKFTTYIHSADRSRVKQAIEQTITTGKPFEQEYRTTSHDGEVHSVIGRGRVETDNEGQPARFLGVVVDISERKQAERNSLFLAQASNILASSLDYNKTLRTVTKLAITELADWCVIDLLQDGKPHLAAIAHKDPKRVAWAKRLRKLQPVNLDDPSGVAAVLRTGKAEFYPVIDDDMLVATSRSQEQLELARNLNLTSALVVPLHIGGKTIGALTMISCELKRHYTTDDLRMAQELANRASMAISNADLYQTAQQEIAARVKLEEELRQANEFLEARVQQRTAQLQAANDSLQSSNQELQDFAYVASHDLQEPLRKIQAFGNLLEDEYARQLGDGKEYLNRMRNAAGRMSVLIEDLLTFSRVTTKARMPDEVELKSIINDVLSDLEIRINESQATITIGHLPCIEADGSQMRQLFQNLIGNALKFTRPGTHPSIRIQAKATDPAASTKAGTAGMWEISVQDNGIGFDEKYLDRIFAVFQRLHDKDTYQGTGIGLAICRKIVERHGGTITATSTVGKGSTFTISLPGRQKGMNP